MNKTVEFTCVEELPELEDILHTLVFEDEPTIFSEEHAVDMVETALHLMEEYVIMYPNAISEPDFHETLLEEIQDIFYVQMEDHILDSDFIEDDMNELLEDAFQIFITTFHPERSLQHAEEENQNENQNQQNQNKQNQKQENNAEHQDERIVMLSQKIQALRDIPQPVQRTPEWYQFRWNLITASNAWKAFDTPSTVNQLIYEKCQPLKDLSVVTDVPKMVNTNTTLHWGQKYEPLSVMLYEHLYKSKVEDFGCLQHPKYKFVGASPDGIVIESCTGRFGRMLEIKNIVNREITGIPKKEYWVQMQLQMEVCDLDECDFLETKFVEYANAEEFHADTEHQKGIILYFHTKEGAPFYRYKPLDIQDKEDIESWEESELEKYESEPYHYVFIKYLYWKLEKLSCVLVSRNHEWFKQNVGQLANVWNIIEEERVTGYEHRAPTRRTKKPVAAPGVTVDETCYLKVVKLDG